VVSETGNPAKSHIPVRRLHGTWPCLVSPLPAIESPSRGVTLVVAVTFASGCASGSSSSLSNEPLAVLSTDPPTGAINVALSQCPTVTGDCGAVYTVTFNKEVDMTTLDLQLSPNISGFLRCPAAGPGISGCPGGNPGSGILPNQSAVVMFVGNSSPYAPNTMYRVTLVSARDTNGVPIAESYTWSFTTATN
jgi:hypothetical protein